MNNDAIVVSNLRKAFRLPHEKKNTLYESITGIFKHNGHEDFVALKNINFVVKKGEAVGIIGENGSGKSTLLKIITNILRADKGSVRINGKITSFLELGVGFQPDLTVKENVYLYGAVMGMSDRDIDNKIEEILDFSGLKRFEDAKLKNLSSGMQVRIAFATAIQTDPEILLMDEVLAVGDMEFQQKCLEVFQMYIKAKKTIVFVSHDLSSVRKFCSKTLLLRHGEQVAFGNTNEIIDRYIYKIGDTGEKTTSIQSGHGIEDKSEKEEMKVRWGNKKVEITNTKLIDKFGMENYNFVAGDSMEIKIYYKTENIVHSPIFGIGIFDRNGKLYYGTNTKIKCYDIPYIKGDGIISVHIESIPLLSGSYDLQVAVVSSDLKETFDWHQKIKYFIMTNVTDDIGEILFQCKWSND
jgi:lipopolysaccharide transport system ATP-binding protein